MAVTKQNRLRGRHGGLVCALVLLALGTPAHARAAKDAPIAALDELSLEELSGLQVTSVSKSPELLQDAPAAIYVITHDDIVRSGVTSIPEALRLAPNLQVSQYSSSRYVVGARGFAGAEEAQNFSNKLLILIDGRSVYSPLFSGVYLDVQDVLLDDIDRIEVISGPGATLWGANAMNGVINIVTKPSYVTDSALVTAGGGNVGYGATARYGTRVDEHLSYRTYAKAFRRDALELADGSDAGDDWYKAQAGFRSDWNGLADTVTVQGDGYFGEIDSPGMSETGKIEGGNLLGRWQHRTERHGEWQLQAYYDYTRREQVNGPALTLQTGDVEFQRRVVRAGHRIVWGAGVRHHHYDIRGTPDGSLTFDPAANNLWLGNIFAQDTLALADDVDLTLGLKLEKATYDDWTPLPDLRLAWRLDESQLVWAAASRAIRSPTPFDHDVIESVPGAVLLTGNKDFESEKVDAFEIGYRAQPWEDISFSASVFYNLYDDLRTVEIIPDPELLVLQWDNLMRGRTWGVEAWGKWQVTSWWRLSPGLRSLHKDLEFKPGATAIVGTGQAGNDPDYQVMLNSAMDLSPFLSLQVQLRHVDELPAPPLGSYQDLSASFNSRFGSHLDVALTGYNLLDDGHQEYPGAAGQYIPRSFLLRARYRF